MVTYDQYLELDITKDEMKNFISSLLNDYKHDLQITSQGFYKYLNLKLEEFNK